MSPKNVCEEQKNAFKRMFMYGYKKHKHYRERLSAHATTAMASTTNFIN